MRQKEKKAPARGPPLTSPVCGRSVFFFFFPAALQAADGKKSLHEVTRADRDFCKTHFHGLTISVHKPIGGGGGGGGEVQIPAAQNQITHGGVM